MERRVYRLLGSKLQVSTMDDSVTKQKNQIVQVDFHSTVKLAVVSEAIRALCLGKWHEILT